MNATGRFIIFLLTLLIIALLSWGVIFFAQGYRISGINQLGSQQPPALEKTGMLVVNSRPEGARVFIDGKLEGPSSVSVTSLSPEKHSVRIVKEGYFDYEKTVTIYEELVTVVDALLIPLSPNLTPLTYNGVVASSQSPSGDLLVYAGMRNGEPGGLYKLDIQGGLRSSLLISDRSGVAFSQASEFHWSPSESELLVKVNAQYYLLSLEIANLSPNPVEAEAVFASWQESAKKRSALKLEKLDIPQNLQAVATASSALWSPDENRFLYKAVDPALETIQYRVYSLAKPRPVGELADYIAFEKAQSDRRVKNIFWYGDSRHLVIVEEGKIFIKEIDNDKKILLFSGDFVSDKVFAKPGGGGVIILTSFNENAPRNFYLVGI